LLLLVVVLQPQATGVVHACGSDGGRRRMVMVSVSQTTKKKRKNSNGIGNSSSRATFTFKKQTHTPGPGLLLSHRNVLAKQWQATFPMHDNSNNSAANAKKMPYPIHPATRWTQLTSV